MKIFHTESVRTQSLLLSSNKTKHTCTCPQCSVAIATKDKVHTYMFMIQLI